MNNLVTFAMAFFSPVLAFFAHLEKCREQKTISTDFQSECGAPVMFRGGVSKNKDLPIYV